MPVAKEGAPWIFTALFAGVIASKTYPFLGLLLVFLAALFVFFFRDPHRKISYSDDHALSPADGKIVAISTINFPSKAERKIRVSIYLSLLDVHITRSPIAGQVKQITYTPGKFHAAFKKEALDANENNLIELQKNDSQIFVRQIAGTVARRIVCYCKEGQNLNQGEKIGIIQFSSCVQIYLPADAILKIKKGDKVKGGLSTLAVLSKKKTA